MYRLYLVAGLLFIVAGVVFHQRPQIGFQIFNWPLAASGTDGRTEAGKRPYRIRGVLAVLFGLALCIVSLAIGW